MKIRLAAAGAAALAGALVLTGSAYAGASDDSPPPVRQGQPEAITAKAPPVYQPDTETRYVPITPCRIVDTRKGTGANGTPLGPGVTRTYYVGGTTGFAPQGGRSTGCGIPVGATAVSAVVTVIKPKVDSGYLQAWPAGVARPTASLLYYTKKQSSSAGATLTLATDAAKSLSVRNVKGKVKLTIDVQGYYVKPLAAFISASGAAYSGSSRIVNATRISTGVYEVQFDRSIRYCTSTVTPYVSSYFASASTWYDSTRPDTVRVWLWDAGGAVVDQYFYIDVEC